jgi:hypothetical protein
MPPSFVLVAVLDPSLDCLSSVPESSQLTLLTRKYGKKTALSRYSLRLILLARRCLFSARVEDLTRRIPLHTKDGDGMLSVDKKRSSVNSLTSLACIIYRTPHLWTRRRYGRS